MTPQEFQKRFESKLKSIDRYVKEDLPRTIGVIAVAHFEENFRLGGFVDDKLEPWKPSKRIGQDKSAASNYGTLLSSRARLAGRIRYVRSGNKVTIISSEPYSKIHNEGGTITQTITPQMRRFAWAKYYQVNPEGKGDAGGQWKGLALTKKTTRTFTIPKRKFIAHSKSIFRKLEQQWTKDILRIITN